MLAVFLRSSDELCGPATNRRGTGIARRAAKREAVTQRARTWSDEAWEWRGRTRSGGRGSTEVQGPRVKPRRLGRVASKRPNQGLLSIFF